MFHNFMCVIGLHLRQISCKDYMTIQNEILCKCLGFSVFNVGLEFLPPDFDFGKSIIILNGVYQYDQPSCQEVQCNDCVFALDVNISCASDKTSISTGVIPGI